jgi:hypothetical protein
MSRHCPTVRDVVVYMNRHQIKTEVMPLRSNCYCGLQANSKKICLQNVGEPDEQFEICGAVYMKPTNTSQRTK